MWFDLPVNRAAALLPFSPCGRRWREAPDEGFSQRAGVAETDPSSVSLPLRVSDPPSPTRGEGKSDVHPRQGGPSVKRLRRAGIGGTFAGATSRSPRRKA